MRDRRASTATTSRGGFTLIELLVVIAVIGILLGILVPVVSSSRKSARDVQCASNMRQIATALIAYAGQSNGAFPPNSGESGQFWYLKPIIGPYLTGPRELGRAGEVPQGAENLAGLAGGVFVCPNDFDDAGRSYSLNVFASSGVSSRVRALIEGPNSPGKLFKFGAPDSSRLMLLLETWTELPVRGTSDPVIHAAQAIVGLQGKPGARFGGNRGIGWKTPPDGTPGRFADRDSQITYYRHDRSANVEEPHGKCNFAFADGHVAMLSQAELVRNDRFSSYVALWSTNDQELESEHSGNR